jgi:superfamily I DNA/RNA helicase
MRAMEDVYRRRIKNSKRKHPSQILSDLVFLISVSATDYGETRALVEESDKVVITTVHKAKGLEWDAVFIPRFVEGALPTSHAKTTEQIDEEYSEDQMVESLHMNVEPQDSTLSSGNFGSVEEDFDLLNSDELVEEEQ